MYKKLGSFNPLQKKHFKLDVKDRKILFYLLNDSRMPFSILAKKVGLSKETVLYRYNRFLKNNIILRNHPIIDYEKLGYQRFHVLIILDESDKDKQKKFVDFLKEDKSVLRILEYSGHWDLELIVLAKSLKEFDDLLQRLLEPFKSIIIRKDTEAEIDAIEHHSLPEIKQLKIKSNIHSNSNSNNLKKSNYDELDLEIIKHLSEEARMSSYDLSKKIKLSSDAIRIRIKKLVEKGIIEGFTTQINFSAFNYHGYVFNFNTSCITKKQEMELFSYCKNNHNFIAVKRLIGDWDFRTYLVVKDSNVFHDIVSQLKIQFNQDIRNYETWVIYYEHYFNSFPEVLLKSLVN